MLSKDAGFPMGEPGGSQIPLAARVPAWPELESILRRGLAKDPAKRFPSLEALAHEIVQFSTRRST